MGRARNQRRRARKLLEQQPANLPSIGELPARVQTLLHMLTYRRPAGSQTERQFITRFLAPLGVAPDEYGNLWVDVLDQEGERPCVIWSSHTDTVHTDGGIQKVLYGDGVATSEGSNCLGADCTVGVWLMMYMIRAKVAGRYVFHAEEEIGGLGSSWVADKGKDYLSGIKFAIAFDRKGTDEIITHQGFERGASEAFSGSLAGILHPLKYKSSDGGTFTDTANYFRIVPECANLSVGYYNQHTAKELLDVNHACALLDRLITADFSTLVCERDPSKVEYAEWGDYEYGGYSGQGGKKDHDATLEGYVYRNPSAVADFLIAHGFNSFDVEQWLWGDQRTATASAVKDAIKRWEAGPDPTTIYRGPSPDRFSAATRAVASRLPDDCPDDDPEDNYTAEDAERKELPFWMED